MRQTDFAVFPNRLSIDEYHRLIHSGRFERKGRHELLDGFVVAKGTHSPSYSVAVSLALRQLLTRLPPQSFCRVQSAITLATSEPEPDLAVVLGPERRYAARHPSPSDVALVVKVAESSIADDRSEKGAIYSQAAIPQFWIVNLVDRCVEVYADPTGPASSPGYRSSQSFDSRSVVPLPIEGRDCGLVSVSELLP
jgi:hypothetical protein